MIQMNQCQKQKKVLIKICKFAKRDEKKIQTKQNHENKRNCVMHHFLFLIFNQTIYNKTQMEIKIVKILVISEQQYKINRQMVLIFII